MGNYRAMIFAPSPSPTLKKVLIKSGDKQIQVVLSPKNYSETILLESLGIRNGEQFVILTEIYRRETITISEEFRYNKDGMSAIFDLKIIEGYSLNDKTYVCGINKLPANAFVFTNASTFQTPISIVNARKEPSTLIYTTDTLNRGDSVIIDAEKTGNLQVIGIDIGGQVFKPYLIDSQAPNVGQMVLSGSGDNLDFTANEGIELETAPSAVGALKSPVALS